MIAENSITFFSTKQMHEQFLIVIINDMLAIQLLMYMNVFSFHAKRVFMLSC